MQIFSGSTNPSLARKIARNLDVPMGKVELSVFPNNELRVWVKEKKVDKDVAVVQSFAGDPNKAIIEFCLLIDALRRCGAHHITAVIPWMGYCIQDKIFRPGEALSAKVVANIIQSVNPNRIITVDLHNESIQGFFSVPITHLSANPLFIDLIKQKKAVDCIVSPDVGALKETTRIAYELNLPMVVVNKKRDLKTGEVSIISISGDCKDKRALIMDDFISTGGTLIQTINFLKKNKAKKTIVAATHHLFVEGTQQKLAKSSLNELYITDTVDMPQLDTKVSLETNIISVSGIIAEALAE
ncbi:MAG: ribose-phosphate diphosphokinase [Patescibacteria group bacterium]|jgi:ribose-phosphate pyrophosphokinase